MITWSHKERSTAETKKKGIELTLCRAVENARPRSTLGKVVVGVPAYFTSLQRQATLDAAHIGGFSGPVELVEEPVCATVAHLRDQPPGNWEDPRCESFRRPEPPIVGTLHLAEGIYAFRTPYSSHHT